MNVTIVREILAMLLQTEILLRIGFSSFFLVLLMILSSIVEINLEKMFLWSFLRGFLQILLMGSVLLVIFELDKLWVLYLVLGIMCGFASFTLSRRYPYPNVFSIILVAITFSSMLIMSIVMFSGLLPKFEGVIPYPPSGEYVITMGSTVISNTMAISSIVLERIKSDILNSRGKIEAALALGATPSQAVKPIHYEALRAGIVPTINTVAVLGVVKIPGWMSGMIVGGLSPIPAAIYQVIIYLMLLSSAFISSIIVSLLFTNEFFTKNQQLSFTYLQELQKQ